MKLFFFIETLDFLNSESKLKKFKLTGNIKEKKTFTLFFDSPIVSDKLIESYLNTHLFEYVEPNFKGTYAGNKTQTSFLMTHGFTLGKGFYLMMVLFQMPHLLLEQILICMLHGICNKEALILR